MGAQSLGYSGLMMPDHLLRQYATIPLLAAAAMATETLRVGTFVLKNNLRHPAVLAHDLATLDRLSGGRLEVGIGAGWNEPEHRGIGIPFEPAGVRVAKLAEAVAVLKDCFGDGKLSFASEHYTITDRLPRPAQAVAVTASTDPHRRWGQTAADAVGVRFCWSIPKGPAAG